MSGPGVLHRHDLGTLLNQVLGYGELLQDAPGLAAVPRLGRLLSLARDLVATIDGAAVDGGSIPPQARLALARQAAGLVGLAHTLAQGLLDPQLHEDLRRLDGAARSLADLLQVLPGEGVAGSAAGAAWQPAAPGEEADLQPASGPTCTPVAATGRLLVADDDRANLEFLCRLLRRDGHQVLPVTGGQAALAALEANAVDLLLLDVHMPDLDGHAVLQALRADARWRELPVLMVSADHERDSALRGIELGATDHLPKPVDLPIMRARIARCLEHKRLRDRERQLQQQRTDMLATISHDLRQPLQATRLYASTAAARARDPEVQALLRRSERATQAAVDMLDQFGDMAALEQGALQPRPTWFDLRELLQETAERLRPLAVESVLPGAGLPVGLSVRGRTAWVCSDRTMCGRIVQNLVSNALRCTARESRARRPRVLLALRPCAGGVTVQVWDNGPGMAQADRDRLFEPYVQRQHGGGRGLGLHIVAGLARQLALSLPPVVSTPGQGSRFAVHWPAVQTAHRPPWEKARHPAVAPGEAGDRLPLEGRLLALIDNDEQALHALVTSLTAAGAHCLAATRVPELRRVLDASLRFPDALVFDLDLGDDLDGATLARELLATWETRLPVVLVTGRRGHTPALEPDWLLLHKPVALQTLCDALAAPGLGGPGAS
jgi:two-component system sensor histidine kinase/response regulator